MPLNSAQNNVLIGFLPVSQDLHFVYIWWNKIIKLELDDENTGQVVVGCLCVQ